MQLLNLTLDSPAENLALDEALLSRAEDLSQDELSGGAVGEVVRLWEAPTPFVVLGSSSQRSVEANLVACHADGVPVLRRASGGAAIVTGPGCLMYAVILSTKLRPELKAIDACHRFVLDRLVAAIGRHVPGVARAGTSDLILNERKFSGNSLRCKRRSVLYHGTLLYDYPLTNIAKYLDTPPRQPGYRAGRAHHEFVSNLPIDRATLVGAIAGAFDANKPVTDWPRESTRQLVEEKYSRNDWNARL